MLGLGSSVVKPSAVNSASSAPQQPGPQKIVVYQSDFSTDTDGWGNDPIGNSTITGASTLDGVSDCLLIEGSATAFQSDSVFDKTSPTIPENTEYFFQADMYLASGSYDSRGFIRVGTSGDIDMWNAGSYSSLTKDEWVQVTGSATITTTNTNWTIGLQDSTVINSSDQFAIKNIEVYYYS